MCELDMRSGKWAWPNETNLHVGLPNDKTPKTTHLMLLYLERGRWVGVVKFLILPKISITEDLVNSRGSVYRETVE